jgi:ribonuclease P protein component
MKRAFSKDQRLVTAFEFKKVFDVARKIYSKKCAIYYCANQHTFPRLGVIVSKKNVHKAVQRNLFKRIVRESFRKIQPKLNGLDIVVFAYRDAATANKLELRKCLDELWQKLIHTQPAS